MMPRRASSTRWRFPALLVVAAALLLLADWWTGGVTRDWVQGRAEVTVTTAPPGATVRVDGIEQGATPVRLTVAPGPRTLVLSHPYHPQYLAHLDLGRGERFDLNVTLEPASGALLVVSNPRGAEVRIDGVVQDGVTPLRIDALPAGRHAVELRGPGRVTRVDRVEVLPDQQAELVVELERSARARLRITTVPAHAVAELIDAAGQVHPGDAILPVGDYTLRVRAPGYRTLERPQRLRVGERLLSVTLERAS